MAMMIPENVIDDIRESVNIVDVINPIVQLQRQGRNFFGKCPFHEEKTASFSVNQEKQIFHCFSCGRGGNVYKFFMDLDGDTFPQAVAKVADIAGKPLDDQYKTERKPIYNQTQLQLIELHDQAMRLYHHILINTDLGKSALNYLINDRKLSLELIEKYQIGFAAPQQKLLDFFRDKNIDSDLLKKSELFFEDDQKELHDRFLNRIVFPIVDLDGNPVGFSGRALDTDNKVKYMNSPESTIFNKSQLLFNLNLAKNQLRENKKIILVEGFMDVISLSAADLENSVASMGTSLTNQQIRMIEKFSDTVVIAYDGDQAGMDAAFRALNLIKNNSKIKIELILLPDGLDPDEFRRKNGNQALNQRLSGRGLTPGSFVLKYLRSNKNLSNEIEKIEYINQSLEQIKILDDPIEQDIHLQQLADEFKLDKNNLIKQLESLKVNGDKNKNSKQQVEPVTDKITSIVPMTNSISRAERAEQLLLSALMDYQEAWEVIEKYPNFEFSHADYQSIFYILDDYKRQHQKIKIADFLNQITNDRHYRLLVSIDELDKPIYQENQIKNSVEGYIKTIITNMVNKKIDNVNLQLKQVELVNDSDSLKLLNQQLIELKREKEKMESA